MPDKDDIQKRSFYRLKYPHDNRPILELGGVSYEVSDVSEQGMAVLQGAGQPDLPVRFQGTVIFGDRGSFQVAGQVIRVDEDSWALKLNTPIPLEHIMAEQRYLIKNYSGT